MFSSGAAVVLRQLFRGRIWSVHACHVVEDGPAGTVLWLPAEGTRMGAEGELFGDWTLVPGRVHRAGILRLTEAESLHSLLRFEHDDGGFRGWYVNFERPQRHTPVGFDIDDLLLDLWFPAAGEPRWLDEDELAEGLAGGFVSRVDAAAARAEGERLLREPPFPTGWEDWRPDPGWEQPRLPDGWDAWL